MVNELCQLAASGISTTYIAALSAMLLGSGIALFVFRKKLGLHARWLLPVLVLVFSLSTPLQQAVFAQAAGNCTTTQDQQTSGSNNQVVLGGLIDDNPEVSYDEDEGAYGARFSVLPNDNAPNGDPFNVSTLELISNYSITNSAGWENHLILDPEGQTLPDPDSWWWDAPNVWGYWYLDLTCDPEDTEHCAVYPGDYVACTDPLGGTCWPNGNVIVFFTSRAEPDDYAIDYTVRTQSGVLLTPATITVTLPEPPLGPSPIIGSNVSHNHGCDLWPSDFSLNLMDGSFFTTSGPGTLLANTIDLDPDTPGRQTSITIYAEYELGSGYITYTVDDTGILTMTTPQSALEGSDTYILYITIQDSNGRTPDIPASYTRIPGCA